MARTFETKSKAIGEFAYNCRQMPALAGLKVAARLANLLGPGIKSLDGAAKGGMAAVIADLLSNPKLDDQLLFFCQEFAKYTSVTYPDGSAPELATIFDMHFAGRYFDLLQWLAFCFEVNHGSFLAEAGLSVQGLVAALQVELNSRSPKQPEKTGPSGPLSSPGALAKPTGA